MDRRRFAATLAANGCKRRLCASKTRLAGTANTAAGRCAWTQAPAGFEAWRNVSTKFQVLQFNLWQARPTRMRRPNTHTHTHRPHSRSSMPLHRVCSAPGATRGQLQGSQLPHHLRRLNESCLTTAALKTTDPPERKLSKGLTCFSRRSVQSL